MSEIRKADNGDAVTDGGRSEGHRLYKDVAKQLYDQIRDGEYKVGDRLPPERFLIGRFSVSRPTVREALIALEVQGYVEVRAGSGTHVIRAPTENGPSFGITAFELTEARLAIEGEAAALATTLIDAEELDKLDALVDRIELDNRMGGDAEGADREFHLLIAHATRNVALQKVIEILWDMRDSSPDTKLLLSKALSANVRPVVAEHRAIAKAIRARDAGAARLAMRSHLAAVLDHLLFATEEAALERARAEVRSTRARFSLARQD
ncbi:MAG TPA: FadR/GntR family transcriptional regulator [Sphingobium sp.]|uniref:FadR/GntR family transcriptional regulator n=1 Tax=Sphingobium sp. TaxID=1912891 RepID=UPI002ED36DE5